MDKTRNLIEKTSLGGGPPHGSRLTSTVHAVRGEIQSRIMVGMGRGWRIVLPAAVVAAGLLTAAFGQWRIPERYGWRTSPDELEEHLPASAEFHFTRLEYKDLPFARRNWRGGWWAQDWPEAEAHFADGLSRLTRISVGKSRHFSLFNDRIFEHPFLYATQVGNWDLSNDEIARLREYLLRGGFLVVDDFYGPEGWAVAEDALERLFPEYPVVDLEDDDPLLHVVYDIRERTFIPGLRHLRQYGSGVVEAQPLPWPPAWRGIRDDKGRLLVAINFNMDMGDAWEHADTPEYPARLTILAYHFGINYIVYAMTH